MTKSRVVKLESQYFSENQKDADEFRKQFCDKTGYVIPKIPVGIWFAVRLTAPVNGCCVAVEVK